MSHKLTTGGAMLIGAMAPALLKAVTPVLIQVLRPVLREVIKAGVLVSREVRSAADAVREDLEDINAEVRAEMDASERNKNREN